MQLFLLRHGEAEPEAATDEMRALTIKGSKQAQSVGKFCLKHGFVPEIILTSPATRAEETARLVAGELNSPGLVQVAEFLRSGMTTERAISGLRQVLAGLGKEKYQEKRSIMLVGHEPDFGILAGILIGGCPESVHFRKAALMDLTVRELKPGGATIEFLIPVKCL